MGDILHASPWAVGGAAREAHGAKSTTGSQQQSQSGLERADGVSPTVTTATRRVGTVKAVHSNFRSREEFPDALDSASVETLPKG